MLFEARVSVKFPDLNRLVNTLRFKQSSRQKRRSTGRVTQLLLYLSWLRGPCIRLRVQHLLSSLHSIKFRFHLISLKWVRPQLMSVQEMGKNQRTGWNLFAYIGRSRENGDAILDSDLKLVALKHRTKHERDGFRHGPLAHAGPWSGHILLFWRR